MSKNTQEAPMSDCTSTTDALFIGGPWDNATSHLQGRPPVFHVQTHHDDSGTTTHKYWTVSSGGDKQLYLYVKENEPPRRVACTLTTRYLDAIGDVTCEAVFQVVGQGGDERTVTTTTSVGGTGSRVIYTVTARAFVVPTSQEEA